MKFSRRSWLLNIAIVIALVVCIRYTPFVSSLARLVSFSPRTQVAAISGAGSNLVGWWTFDTASITSVDGQHETVADASDSGNPASISEFNSVLPETVSGKIGEALHLDAPYNANPGGSPSQSIGVTLSSSLSAGSAYTLSLWAKNDQPQTSPYSFFFGDATLNDHYFIDFSSSTNTIGASNDAGNNATFSNNYSSVLADTGWHLYTFVLDGSNIALYLDGSFQEQKAFVSPAVSSFLIGGHAAYSYKGSLDDIRLYSRALQLCEVLDIYNAGNGNNTSSCNGSMIPGSIHEASHSNTQASLTWTSANGGASPVVNQLERADHGVGNWTNLNGATGNSFTDTGLSMNSSYDYRVQYTDAAAAVAYSNTITVTAVFGSTYYIDYNGGDDANIGTAKDTPWKHAPGMQGCTGLCASKVPAPGDRFILKGGVTWPSAALGWGWGWMGTQQNPVYIGVDQTWWDPNGTSQDSVTHGNSCSVSTWCRPILDGGLAPLSTVGNVFLNVGASDQSKMFLTIEGIEFKGLYFNNGQVAKTHVTQADFAQVVIGTNPDSTPIYANTSTLWNNYLIPNDYIDSSGNTQPALANAHVYVKLIPHEPTNYYKFVGLTTDASIDSTPDQNILRQIYNVFHNVIPGQDAYISKAGGANVTMNNMYMHGWSYPHLAPNYTDGGYGFVGFGGDGTVGSTISNTTCDGWDTYSVPHPPYSDGVNNANASYGSLSCVFGGFTNIYNNIFRNVGNGFVGGSTIVHDNLIENIGLSISNKPTMDPVLGELYSINAGGHANGFENNSDCNLRMYNNTIRHIYGSIPGVWISPLPGCTDYFFNNVLVDHPGQIIDLGNNDVLGCVPSLDPVNCTSDKWNWTGSVVLLNNTVEMGADDSPDSSGAAVCPTEENNRTEYPNCTWRNNHFSKTVATGASPSAYNLTESNNVYQTAAVAAAQGLLPSNQFAPSNSNTSLFGAGMNLTSLCNSDPSLAALCYGINGVHRPSEGAWDVGAYQYCTSNCGPSTFAVNRSVIGVGSITCGTTCPTATTTGATITFTATPSGGSSFSGWSGGSCSGSATTCTVTIGTADITIVATFTGGTDTTPPSISAISAVSITTSGATIQWGTNENADSRVIYGLTTAYGNDTGVITNSTQSHSIVISGLAANTTYHYQVISVDGSSNLATSTDHTFTTSSIGPGPGDTTPPVISAITVLGVTTSGATIQWTTNESADSQVKYDVTSQYGQQTAVNSTLSTAHSVVLTNLASNTLYHYQILTKDSSSNLATSSDATFATLAPDTIGGGGGGGGGGGTYVPPTVIIPTATTTKSIPASLGGIVQSITIPAVPSTFRFTKLLSVNQTNIDISYLQNILYTTKYLTTTTFTLGTFDQVTYRALGAYQVATKITTLNGPGYGQVGPKTRDALNKLLVTKTFPAVKVVLTATVAAPQITSVVKTAAPQVIALTTKSQVPGTPITTTLIQGSQGAQVTTLQNVLVAQNLLLPKYATGYYGALTTTAVQAFQKKYGIVSSGTPGTTGFGSVGAKTRTKINSFITTAPAAPAVTPTPQKNSVTTPKSTISAVTTPAPSATTVSASIFTRSLRQGDTGADVKSLQIFLNNHGFLVAQSGPGSKGQETSTFDASVKAALIRFQNANASQVLTPYGLSEGSGYFDSGTMKVVKMMTQ